MPDTTTHKGAFITVPLDHPIERGENTIDSLQIRKPHAGELRGVSIAELAKLDVTTVLKLLPRITVPPITAEEAGRLELSDLFSCATEIGSFLLSKAALQDFPEA